MKGFAVRNGKFVLTLNMMKISRTRAKTRVLLGVNSVEARLNSLCRLPHEKVGDARREFVFWPLRGTKRGVVQAFFDP